MLEFTAVVILQCTSHKQCVKKWFLILSISVEVWVLFEYFCVLWAIVVFAAHFSFLAFIPRIKTENKSCYVKQNFTKHYDYDYYCKSF